MQTAASARARWSASNTSSRAATSVGVRRSSTRSMTAAIDVKFNRPPRNAATAASFAAFRIAGAVPPLRAACSASAKHRNLTRSGASKRSAPWRTRSKDSTPDSIRSGHASAWAMGVRMSGLLSWASVEPSTYSTSEWTMLSGCTSTSTAPGGRPNNSWASMSSRPLFISVAESTEILRPMTQRGWAQASSAVTAARRSLGTRRNGPPEAVSRIRRTPAARTPGRQALEDRVVLAVDRQELRAAGRHRLEQQAPGHDQRLLVGEQHALAGPGGRERRGEPRAADDRRHHDACARPRGRGREPALARLDPGPQPIGRERRREPPRAVEVGEHREVGPEAPALLGEGLPVAGGRERDHLEAPGVARDDVERAAPDAAGRAQDRDAGHFSTPSQPRPSTKKGTPDVRLSMRSSTPPWPGSSVPESLRPAWRLNMLSVRSPTTEAMTTARPSIPAASGGRFRTWAPPIASASPPTSPPSRPSQVLFGLTSGASFRRPNARPAK